MIRPTTLLSALTVLVTTTVFGAAQTAGDNESIAEKDVPQIVASRMKCGTPSGDMTRRAFAGGFIFVRTCTAGGEAQQRAVYAVDRDGKDARLLQFHRPEGRRLPALVNLKVDTANTEISGSTGRLTRRICKAEGRWQMEGKKPAPALVFWRHTGDCDGKTGWQVMLNRKDKVPR